MLGIRGKEEARRHRRVGRVLLEEFYRFTTAHVRSTVSDLPAIAEDRLATDVTQVAATCVGLRHSWASQLCRRHDSSGGLQSNLLLVEVESACLAD